MKSKGHLVSTANSGEQALKAIQSEPFDLVFLDLHMPNVNGIETLSQIRMKKKDLPVILVTAYLEDETLKEAEKLGISGLFPKEGSFEKLTSMMEVALRTHQQP